MTARARREGGERASGCARWAQSGSDRYGATARDCRVCTTRKLESVDRIRWQAEPDLPSALWVRPEAVDG